MKISETFARSTAVTILAVGCLFAARAGLRAHSQPAPMRVAGVLVHHALRYDVSPPLASLRANERHDTAADCGEPPCGLSPAEPEQGRPDPAPAPAPEISAAGAAVEQTSQGKHPAIPLLDSFDGLGEGFQGPQGTGTFRNPSDNSLATGPDDIVQIVNSRFAVFTKKGSRYNTTGKVLYGPVPTNAVFAGFGGVCDARDNGDAVVRYDQIAGRWLFVMPIFSRVTPGEFSQTELPAKAALPGQLAHTGQTSAPGAPAGPPAN